MYKGFRVKALLICFVWVVYNAVSLQSTRFSKVVTDFETNPVSQQSASIVGTKQIKKENCVKPANAKSHIICETLPFQKPACRNNTEGLVPNIVHYVWIGNGTLKYYHYISILSVATNHKPDKMIFHINDVVPQGELWLNLVAQIPCLEVSYFQVPKQIYGNRISDTLTRTDVARFQILLKHGGIYLDSDVIVLKSLDPLRQYPFTMGFNGLKSLSAGAILSTPNAKFLAEILNGYKNLTKIRNGAAFFSCHRPRSLALRRKDLPIHIEETSMQRPNMWADEESVDLSNFDISNNYMLHIHPRSNVGLLTKWRANQIRIHDSTYGAAARAALFGTQDLVFLREEAFRAKDRNTPTPMKLYLHNETRPKK